MAEAEPSREKQIREVLISAVEVQLAALKAGVSFWREWMEQTASFVKTATKTLGAIRSQDKNANQVLLEIVDASRESMRAMTELPRSAAARFIDELDQIEQARKARAGGGPRRRAGGRQKKRPAAAPRRRGRVKP